MSLSLGLRVRDGKDERVLVNFTKGYLEFYCFSTVFQITPRSSLGFPPVNKKGI